VRRSLTLGAATVAFALAGLSSAQAETLITSLSSHRVFITSNYTGTAVAVFGAIERDAQTVSRAQGYDVVVTVRGPREAITVREKERTGLIWINREQQKFPFAPAYLAVLTSRPVPEITSEALAQRFRIGISAIVGAPEFTLDRGPADDPFRVALIRLKQQDRLYVEINRGVTFLSPTLFRAATPLPATAPPGNYDVEVMLLADSVVLAQTRTSFELEKSGFEQQVADVARDWSSLYGLATGAIALLFGWIASVIFRRD
jgi:uncharacterized protein (TIGR02186 family)